MQELTIKDILKILKKRWWMIAAFCILVTAAAGFYYQRQPDVYTAQAILHVLLYYEGGAGDIRFDTYESERFAADFKELLNTQAITKKTLDRLGIQKGDPFDTAIEIEAIASTRLLSISATDKDKEMSVRVANTVSQVFIEYVREEMKINAIKIASGAVAPDAPSGPARMKNTLLAGAVSLVLAIGTALAVEMLNTTLRSADAVESTLGLPVLASIQNYRKDTGQFLHKRLPGDMLSRDISMITKENIRTLATNIQFAAIAHPAQTLLITSSVADEGKSSLLLLLAESFADLGKRVLAVDMDMRHPSIGQYLGTRGRNDLFDYMVGHSRLEEIICKTSNPHIHFIDSRHRLATVSQIVNLEVFERFLDTTKRVYDLILFDTPPLGLFIDAAELANKMDATLLVIGSGMGDRDVIRDAVEQLHKANANILGAALNYVNHSKAHRHYYGKKYGYGAEKKGGGIPFKKAAHEA